MVDDESAELRGIEAGECRNKMNGVSVQTEIETELSELRRENSKLRKQLEEAKNEIKRLERGKKSVVRFDIERYQKTVTRMSSSSLALAVTTCFYFYFLCFISIPGCKSVLS